MFYPWHSTLKYWESGEFQVVRERLTDMDKKGIHYNPSRKDLFKALTLVPFEKVRVAILGQDPYPQSRFATGVAFSIPETSSHSEWPPTLQVMMQEYQDDLHYPLPKSGDLSLWCDRGVLLWNVIPSCEVGKSKSHDWDEWSLLTIEILEKLASTERVVFAFIGSTARSYLRYLPEDDQRANAICVAHPSPRGINLRHGKAFLGSRLFSNINGKLTAQGLDPIDWRLP